MSLIITIIIDSEELIKLHDVNIISKLKQFA